jgi:hypothetical protein
LLADGDGAQESVTLGLQWANLSFSFGQLKAQYKDHHKSCTADWPIDKDNAGCPQCRCDWVSLKLCYAVSVGGES